MKPGMKIVSLLSTLAVLNGARSYSIGANGLESKRTDDKVVFPTAGRDHNDEIQIAPAIGPVGTVQTLETFATRPTKPVITLGTQASLATVATKETEPTRQTFASLGTKPTFATIATKETEPTRQTFATLGTKPTFATIATKETEPTRQTFASLGTKPTFATLATKETKPTQQTFTATLGTKPTQETVTATLGTKPTRETVTATLGTKPTRETVTATLGTHKTTPPTGTTTAFTTETRIPTTEETSTTTPPTGTTFLPTTEGTSTTTIPSINLDPSQLNNTACPSFLQIHRFLIELAQNHPGVSLLDDLYYSHENRPIMMVTVRPYILPHIKNARPNNELRYSHWMEAGLEGNACASVTMLLAMIQMLATSCPRNCQSNYYFIPVANPDGYEYARTTDSGWIKNREPFELNVARQVAANVCYGVRINYNFPPNNTWPLYGSSDPCSQVHRGPSPGSSKEADAMMSMKHSVPKLTISMTFLQRIAETYKEQHILFPLAYNSTYIPDYSTYKWIAHQGETYINSNGGVSTFKGRYYDYHPQSGTSMNYWYEAQPPCRSFSCKIVTQDETMGTKAERMFQGVSDMIDEIISPTPFPSGRK